MAEFECKECGKKLYSEEALSQHHAAKHTKQAEQKPKRHINKSYIVMAVVIILIAAGAYFALTATSVKYDMKGPAEVHFIGNESAKVTVTEFADFECPFCGNFFKNTEPDIKQNYIDTGKIKFVYKNFPLPSHTNAEKAAEAGECASDIGGQDAFWQMHDKMFQNGNLLSVSNLKRFASEIGLNATDFGACLDSGAMRGRVLADQNEGQSLGVAATPSFFVNGQKIEGAQPYSTFKTAIDSKL